jgi:radical SAM protein with 4Fe4S-binding SPASM domain
VALGQATALKYALGGPGGLALGAIDHAGAALAGPENAIDVATNTVATTILRATRIRTAPNRSRSRTPNSLYGMSWNRTSGCPPQTKFVVPVCWGVNGGLIQVTAREFGNVTVPAGSDLFPPELPMAVQVEFTSRCNLRCRMCPLTTKTSSSSQAPGPMTEVVFEEVLGIARRCGRVVLAGYGEPLTNPQCIPLLRALAAEGIAVNMATNGVAITPVVARQLADLERLSIVVSIDSPDPDVYRKVRGGSVHRALRGLRNLMDAIEDPDRVMVTSIAMLDTLATLGAFPSLLAELGVRHYYLQAVVDYNDYSRQQSLLDHVEMAARLEEIEVACVANGIDLKLSAPDRSQSEMSDTGRVRQQFYGLGEWDATFTRQCHVPWDLPFIDKDGRVFACCFAASANEYQLGQIGPDTFDEIWVGERFQRFRADIVDGRTTPGICRRCTVAPLGEHPFKSWAATVESGHVAASARSTAAVLVSVRNHGARTWTAEDRVRVGTTKPRDSDSPLAHPTWLSSNRTATFVEPAVPPGAVATFEFLVVAPRLVTTAEFAIVADGACWLPNTGFVVTVERRPRGLRRGTGSDLVQHEWG